MIKQNIPVENGALLINTQTGLNLVDADGEGIPINTVSGRLSAICLDETRVRIIMKDKGEHYTLCFSNKSKRLLYILQCLTSDWGLEHLYDIRLESVPNAVDYVQTRVWVGGRMMYGHVKKDLSEDDIARLVPDYVKIIIKAINFNSEELQNYIDRYAHNPFNFQEEVYEELAEKSHSTTLPLLRHIQGRNMMASIARAVCPNYPAAMAYMCRTEFNIGNLYADGAIELLNFSSNHPIKICLELKVSTADLRSDKKLDTLYVSQGMFDYYFLVASTPEVAEVAMRKYVNNPAIGVACLENGQVLKVPEQQTINLGQERKYYAECNNRRRFFANNTSDIHSEHYGHDDEMMFLMLHEDEQTIPGMRVTPNNKNN